MRKSQNNLVTRDYLDKKLQDFKVEFKDELYQIKDEIVGEIKAMREEFGAHQMSHARVEETLEDHESRISTLES